MCAAFPKRLQVQIDKTVPGVFSKVCKPENNILLLGVYKYVHTMSDAASA